MKKERRLKRKTENSSQRAPELLGLAFLAVGLFMAAAYFGFSTGSLGSFMAKALRYSFGLGAIVVPIVLLAIGGGLCAKHRNIVFNLQALALGVIYLCLLGFIHHVFVPLGEELAPEQLPSGGGLIGGALLSILRKAAGSIGALILLILGFLGSIVLLGRLSLQNTAAKAGKGLKTVGSSVNQRVFKGDRSIFRHLYAEEDEEEEPQASAPRAKAGRKGSKGSMDYYERTAGEPQVNRGSLFNGGFKGHGQPQEDQRQGLSVYDQKEFANFTEDIKKDSVFKQILNFGNRTKETTIEVPYQDLKANMQGEEPAAMEDYERLGREATEATPRTGPELVQVEDEKQNPVVLRPRIITNVYRAEPAENTQEASDQAVGLYSPEPVDEAEAMANHLPDYRSSAEPDLQGAKEPSAEARGTRASEGIIKPFAIPADVSTATAATSTMGAGSLTAGAGAATTATMGADTLTAGVGTAATTAMGAGSFTTGVGSTAATTAMGTGNLTAGASTTAATHATTYTDSAASQPVTGQEPTETTTAAPEAVDTSYLKDVKITDTVIEAAATEATAGSATEGAAALAAAATTEPEVIEPHSLYKFPPLSLLDEPVHQASSDADEADRNQGAILLKTLADFKISAKIVGITRGPSVTRFELEPAPGVKVSSIVNLADDIALRLAAPGVRIEAPIPGKAAIGIEAPNIKNEMVYFKEVVDCKAVNEAKSKLCVGLGRDISGNVITADLAKMPHLLVAGSTGSGKSVCINTLITGILYKAAPEEVKLILVDPKVVELTNYNGIPHLLVPVVTDSKKAASALHWAVAEMERRYQAFADNRVREIVSYNAQAVEKMPYIVIVIDEMSDLMMVAKADVEDAVLRLAQKARAAGIHLVLATQRPSVDVITGIVKANIPSRIAFAVSSQTDSRTILDMGGAEKLLGKGDMLFYPIGTNKPTRVQGAFVTDAELNRIVDFVKNQAIPVAYAEEVTEQVLPSDKKSAATNDSSEQANGDNNLAGDELFEEAVRLVMDLGQASSSMLQRRFRIGYTRAARLVDTMEEFGIVGPPDGSKPRELIMTRPEIESRFFNKG